MKILLFVHCVFAGHASRLRTSNADSGYFNYNYARHGEDWIAGTCSSRSRQSPIDFPSSFMNAAPNGKFNYAYKAVPKPIELSNNGHSYSLDVVGMGFGGINVADAWFNLMSINVHAQAEHTFNGMHHPIAVHLVHKRYDSDSLVVIAIPFTSSGVGASLAAPYVPPMAHEPNFHPLLQYFLKLAPPPKLEKITVPGDAVSPLDINALMTGGTFFEYSGSLTAPPCAETVSWLVRREPLMASANQIQYLKESIFSLTGGFGNNRAVMPLMGREIYVREGVRDEAVSTGPSDSSTQGSDSQDPTHSQTGGQDLITGRELRAMKWSKDALKIATSAAEYVRDLDYRIHTAAAAHAAAMAPPTEIATLPDPQPLSPSPAVSAAASATASVTASTAPAPAPAAGPVASGETPEQHAERLAKAMSASISQAANEAVAGAMKQITIATRQAAMNAAEEATNAVLANANRR